MDIVTILDLRDLVSVVDGPCISIYMPTSLSGREAQQDSVRLKNLATAANQQLVGKGTRGVDANELIKPILELPSDDVWDRRKLGLAIFRSEAKFVKFWLTIPLEEAAIVDRRFHIKHLLPAIRTPSRFYILAMSRNQVCLLRATWHGFERLHVPDLPMGIAEALNLQGADRGEQVHSGMRGDLGKEAAVFHGQGGHRDTLKDEVFEYFRAIDRLLWPVLRERPWPLILAGVEYELAIFREVSGYRHIAEEMLHGSFDHIADHALYEQALPIAQRLNEKDRRLALSKYRDVADTRMASDSIDEIVSAACEGRIETLLADSGAAVFGHFRVEDNCVELVDKADPALDLVELATAQTIWHDGIVYAAAGDELPSTGPLRAIFRY